MSKECIKCGTLQPLTGFSTRTSSKDGLQNRCKECTREYHKKYQAENKDAMRRNWKRWAAANPDKIQATRDSRKEQHAAYIKEYNKADPSKRRAWQAKRRAAKLQRTPSWSDTAEIALIYKQAASLQKLLGMELHVDHIVPLQGKTVSGLHVPHNLQITTAAYNLSKSNREEHLNEFQSNDTGRTDGYRNNLCVR